MLVEGPSEESELVMVGRHAGQAPEIDGQVYLSGAEVRPGEMRRVRVERATDYDLLGEVVDEEPTVSARRTKRLSPASLTHHGSDGRRISLRVVTSGS